MKEVEVTPTVRRKLKDGRIIARRGRGFSLNELRETGITIDAAKMLGVYVDPRRRSARSENIEALKMLAAKLSEVNSF